MAEFPSITELAKEVSEKAISNMSINNMPLDIFIKRLFSAINDNKCNLTTCRYNKDNACCNEEKHKECIYVSAAVLCIGEILDEMSV